MIYIHGGYSPVDLLLSFRLTKCDSFEATDASGEIYALLGFSS